MRVPFTVFRVMAVSGAVLLAASARAQSQQPGVQPAGGQPAAAQPAAENPAEKPVRDVIQAFGKAYNAADAKALADLFVDGATVVDPSGFETHGKGAIGEMYATTLRDAPGLKLESQSERVRFLTPDVARLEGRSRVFSAGGSGNANQFTNFTALLVRGDGKWRLGELHEQAAPLQDITPYERLQELEWMVGDWVDETDENKVVVNIRWADKKSYLIRTYGVEVGGEKAHSGTMLIGWDPLTEQFKSWVFDSEGGHGEGLWTRTSENQWIVKASGVLRDGRPTSATQIHTILNKDSVKTSSIDRIIGGQIAPDILDIVMVRKPPQPAAAGAAARPAPPAATGTVR
jgi:uncharacterized protein (TIGR02246 family)